MILFPVDLYGMGRGAKPSGDAHRQGDSPSGTSVGQESLFPSRVAREESIAYRIIDALGRSPRARAMDHFIPIDAREAVAEATVMNALADLGSSKVSQPAIEGVLFALSLAHREQPDSALKTAINVALQQRSPEVFEIAETFKTSFLTPDDIRLLQAPELLSLERAQALITKIESAAVSNDLKVVLLSPILVYGDIDSGVKNLAGISVEAINPISFLGLTGLYAEAPF